MQELQFNEGERAKLSDQESPDDGDAAVIRDALYNLIVAIRAERNGKKQRSLKYQACRFIQEL